MTWPLDSFQKLVILLKIIKIQQNTSDPLTGNHILGSIHERIDAQLGFSSRPDLRFNKISNLKF